VTNPNVKAGDLGVPTPGWSSSWWTPTARPRSATRAPTSRRATGAREEETAEAFDEEGFFCTGDAVQWIDETDIHQGLKFDGRIAEDFKLATGTFVSVGPLRAKIIAAGAPYVQDVVLTGLNLKEVGALMFPTPPCALERLGRRRPLKDVLEQRPVLAHFQTGGGRTGRSVPPAVPTASRGCLHGRAPVHRQGRSHRQRLHQPARSAETPRCHWCMRCTMAPCLSPSSPANGSIHSHEHFKDKPPSSPAAHPAWARPPPASWPAWAPKWPCWTSTWRWPRRWPPTSMRRPVGRRGLPVRHHQHRQRRRAGQGAAAHGPARILMNIAGIGTAKRIVGKDGNAAPLEDFARVINVNLIGSYNISRLFAAECASCPPLEDGERGVMMFTASVAAFDGQVGQQAYSAVQGRPGRHDAAHGARPGAARHPRVHRGAGAVCHAADEAAARAGAGLAGGIHPFPVAPGQTRRVCPAGLHTSSPTATSMAR
jgi:hypothetical protein